MIRDLFVVFLQALLFVQETRDVNGCHSKSDALPSSSMLFSLLQACLPTQVVSFITFFSVCSYCSGDDKERIREVSLKTLIS